MRDVGPIPGNPESGIHADARCHAQIPRNSKSTFCRAHGTPYDFLQTLQTRHCLGVLELPLHCRLSSDIAGWT